MTIYKSFSSQNNKISQEWELVENQEHRIVERLKKIEIKIHPSTFLKRISTIPVLKNFVLTYTNDDNPNVHFDLLFIDFPEWAIPMTRIVPTFSLESAFDPENPELSHIYDVNYLWKQVDVNNYQLRLHISGLNQLLVHVQPFDTIQRLTTYVNLNIKILNDRVYKELQSERQ